jgi:CHAT domain-containing protein
MVAMERLPEQTPLNRHTAFISWRWLGFGSLLLMIFAGGILIANHFRGSKIDRGTRALIEAFSKQRMIEPRLSGGFMGAEFKHPTEDISGVKNDEFEKARELIIDAAAMGDPAADLPYARLLLSKNEKLPEALRYLRRVVGRAPESAEAHNDLGVCLIQQEKIEDAIDEFEVALKHRSDMPEALFNRALSYQRLLLKDAARTEFQRASEVDRDESWRVEIRRRIEKLSETGGQPKSADPVTQFSEALTLGRIDDASKVVRENSESVRRHALWDLTTEYLQGAVDGDSQRAERNSSKMDLIGRVLLETMSDSITADVAAYLQNLSDSAKRTELPLIKQYVKISHRAMSDETTVAFERLEKEFHSTGNYVFEALSAFRVADHYYYLKHYQKSLGKLKSLLTSVQSRQWPFDRARFLTLLSLQISRLGQDSLAIKNFQQAVATCSESPGLESKILQYMSVPYLQLGDTDRALQRLRDSTNTILGSSRPTAIMLLDLAYNYFEIARIYSLRNNHSLALLCAQQALSYCDDETNSGYAAEFSSFVALENSRLNHIEEAEANLDRAFKYLEATGQGTSRNMTEARVLINGIQVAAQSGHTERALGYFARAESLAKDAEGTSLLMIDLLQARAGAQIASGDNDGARSDLIRAVSLIESYRANLATSEQRSQFLDASHRIYDQLISIDVGALNRLPEAFELSERSRARALLEEISQSSSVDDQLVDQSGETSSGKSGRSAPVAPLSLGDIQSQLPDDLTVLQYAVTGNGSYLFLITRSELKVKATTATTETLDQLAREYISLLQSIAPLDEVKAKGQELYDYLIKPVEKELSGAVNLIIVPDKALHFLPFPGLVDGNNRYLIDSYRLSYAPSASVLIRCLKEDEAHTGGGTERILAVGNPSPLSENSRRLPPLHDAEREADQSARFYDPSSLTITGARATEPAVRSAMMECDVAHLAVHCVVDDRSPWLAALVLAGTTPAQDAPLSGRAESTPTVGTDVRETRSSALINAVPYEPVGDANDGMLYLNEFYGIKLPRTRLVVLSACKSGLGQYYRGEGIVSLVRPLLAAGVPTIVASLWPVDSKATSDLMIEFHRQRKRSAGTLAAEALRKAQVELARTYPHPYYWAPFIVVGSGVASR